jgi:hypothetical protein
MSNQTYEALEAALRAHVADVGSGAMLTDWRIVAASVSAEHEMGVTGYTNVVSEHSAPHARLGLALVGYRDEKRDWDAQTDADDD